MPSQRSTSAFQVPFDKGTMAVGGGFAWLATRAIRYTPTWVLSTCGEPDKPRNLPTHNTYVFSISVHRSVESSRLCPVLSGFIPVPRYGPFNCIYGFSQGASVATMVAHASNDAALSSRLSQAPRKSKVPYAWRRLPWAPA